MLRLILILTVLILTTYCLNSQNRTLQPTVFTWEGAAEGNKAVWNADDTSNTYLDIDGIDVQIRLIDALHLNTTTENPSEFNDYTKTNTFYGRGNLAFQVKSTQAAQAVCLEFSFSNPIYLNNFDVFDIDMLQSSTVKASTYQDSVSFKAYNKAGIVALVLEQKDLNAAFTIYGQSAKANFLKGINGDVSHTNLIGAVSVKSSLPIERFVLCHSNGSEDDGLSNSHAIKIPGFQFTEFLGTISGKVLDDTTGKPLAGSVIRLLDSEGNLVINKEGWAMQVMTDDSGVFVFDHLPMGTYTISQINPSGYDSIHDMDDINDNKIIALLDVVKPESKDNNFYEIQSAPLAVNLTSFDVKARSNKTYEAIWEVNKEENCHFYQIFGSENGIENSLLSTVNADLTQDGRYSETFEYQFTAKSIYITLVQTDYDGSSSTIGTKKVDNAEIETRIYPNPVGNHLYIESVDVDGEKKFAIFDIVGKQVMSGTFNNPVNNHTIDVSSLKQGVYYVKLITNYSEFTTVLIKN